MNQRGSVKEELALETSLKINIPMKESFLFWLVIRKACLTKDKLQRRSSDLFKMSFCVNIRVKKMNTIPTLLDNYKYVATGTCSLYFRNNLGNT